MSGPGRNRAEPIALAAAISLAAVGGCFDPRYEDCQRACASDEDCAAGQACGAVGMCAAIGEPLACGEPAVPDDPPVPVGTYNLALTNQENGCSFDNWAGGTTTNVGMQLHQMDALVVAEMTGSVGTILESWLGARTFKGPPEGPKLKLVLMGTKNTTQQGCVFTFDLTIDAMATGDLIDGSMFYRARTNGAPGCGMRTGCMTRQAVHGTRTSP